MTTMKVKLGEYVRDALTGYEGIAASKVEMMGGNVQICVQPQVADEEKGKYPDAMNLDHHTLDVLNAGISSRVTEPIPVTVQLGDKVEDIVTGLTGIATVRYTYMNGCIYYGVQPKMMEDKQTGIKGIPDPHHLNQARLKVVQQVVAKIPDAVPTTEGRRPGGPATKAMRQT